MFFRATLDPEVTAIVTTHKRPDRLRDALLSLQQEAHREFECIVVEDGHALDPRQVHEWHPGARLIQGHQLGVAGARNLGLAAAGGTFSIFLDDDDVALPLRIATLLHAAKANDADICYGMTRRVAGDGSPSADVPTHQIAAGPAGFCDVLTCAPHINAVLVRTELLRAVGGFDSGSAHFDDWSAWLRLADRGARIWSVSETLAEWRLHDAGLTGLVARTRALRTYLLDLFDRLVHELSEEGAQAVAAARLLASSLDIETYDDYARGMDQLRTSLHAQAQCLGPRLLSHCG